MVTFRNSYDDNDKGPAYRTRAEADAAAKVQDELYGRVRWYVIVEDSGGQEWDYVGPRPS